MSWGLGLTLAGVSVLALWPQPQALAGGGQDLSIPPEDCFDQPATTLPNPSLAQGGGNPGPNGGSARDTLTTSGGGEPCYEGWDLVPRSGVKTWAAMVGRCRDCAPCEFSTVTGQSYFTWYDVVWRDCPDGFDTATTPTTRMEDDQGDPKVHEGTAGKGWFSLWDPYIVKTGTGSSTEYHVVLGPDLVFGFDDQLDPLCSDTDTEGVTLATDTGKLVLTFIRGVSQVKYEFRDFTQSTYGRGQFAAYETGQGRFYASAYSGGNITQITRKPYEDGVLGAASERIGIGGYDAQNYRGYAYHEYYDGSSWQPTRRVDYSYDATSGDLEAVEYRAGYDGSGSASSTSNWQNDIVGKMIFRYDTDHRLTTVLDTEAVASFQAAEPLLDEDTATEAELADHATRIYTYHSGSGATAWKDGMVASVQGEGCGGCGTSGSEIAVSWVQNDDEQTSGAARYSDWWRRSTEEHKDENGDVYRRETTYINRAGKVLCRIAEDRSATFGAGGTLERARITFSEYDSAGRLTKTYTPSAVSSYPTTGSGEVDLAALDDELDKTDDDDLLGAGKIQFHNDAGIVRVTEYWGASPSPAATTAVRGGVEGYVRYQKVQRGEGGSTSVTLSETLYIKHTASSEDVYQVAEVKQFLDGTSVWTSTVWEYDWHTGTNDIERIERSRFVNENENTAGTDDALVDTVVLSEDDRELWRKSALDVVTYYLYDADTLQRVGMIADVNTNHADLAGVTIPSGMTNTDGLHLRADTETDEYNRVVKVTGPETSADTDGDGVMDETVRPVRWTVYKDGANTSGDWTATEVRTASGYLEGATYHLVGGIQVSVTERGEDGSGVHWSERWVTERDGTTGALTAGEDVDDRALMSGWTRTKTVDGQTTERHAYVDIPSGGGYGDAADEYLLTTTDYYLDGSVRYTEGPDGRRSYSFRDKKTVTGIGDVWETRRYSVYEDGSSDWQLAGPISVSWSDEDGRSVRGFMATVTGALDGEEAAHPTFTGDTLVELSRSATTYDWRNRTLERWGYFELDDTLGSGRLDEDEDGVEGTNYVVSEVLAYDDLGRVLRAQAPSGDISASVYDALGRVTSSWVGTSATGATRTDPGAGASDLVIISRAFYDADGDDTGAPTAQLIRAERLKPNLDAALSTYTDAQKYTGVTYVYDDLGRRTHSQPDVGPWSEMTYSDAGQVTKAVAFVDGDSDGVADNDELLTQSETIFDGAGRVTASRVYEVDGTNAPTKYLQSTVGYDDLGRQALSFNAQGAGTLTQWDDAGRVIHQVLFSDNGGDDTTVTDDRVVTETAIDYLKTGAGAGRPYLRTTYQRNHDAATTNGLLSGLSISQDTYSVTWYDHGGRVTHSAYYGNNGGTAIVDTSSDFDPDAGTVTYANGPIEPNTSDNVIVTKTTYDDATRVDQVMANDGVITKFFYNDAGQRTHVVENYDADELTGGNPDTPKDTRDADVNRVTAFVYNHELGAVIEQIAIDPNHDGTYTDNQTTHYLYSIDFAAGNKGTPSGGVQSNSILRAVVYPDSDDGVTGGGNFTNGADATYDRVQLTYYSDGTLQKRKDQNGTVLQSVYLDDGALEYQDATVLGTNIDGAVRSMGYAYDELRRVTTVTQYDEVSTKSGGLQTTDIVNEVVNTYTDLGQLDEQFQEHDGDKDGSTLSVGYEYDATLSGNHYTLDRRITQLTAPGGTASGSSAVKYGYGADGSIPHELGVVQLLEEIDGDNLVQYKYFGVSGQAEVRYVKPTNDVTLTMHHGDSDGDYEGYDRFYRRVDQYWWQSGGASTRARVQYGYDLGSRRVYHEDVYASAASVDLDQLDARNAFGELTNWKLGDVTTGATPSMGSPDDQLDWTLDQLGNWTDFDSDLDHDEVGGGDTSYELEQSRTNNDVNEITDITEAGGQAVWPTPTYDAAGNMRTSPKADDPGSLVQQRFTYDAWGRLVELEEATPGPAINDAIYEYDGLGRRIAKHVYSTANGSYQYGDHYYYNGWQCIEVRRDTDGTKGGDPDADAMEIFVYHPYYIDAVAVRYWDNPDDGGGLDGTWARHYYLHDAQFNVIAILDDSNTLLERYRYAPYGEQTVMDASYSTKSGGTDYAQYKGFTGQTLDPESGLWYFRARYYHAGLGRFISRDPIGYRGGGMNIYAGYFGMRAGMDPFGLVESEGEFEGGSTTFSGEAQYNVVLLYFHPNGETPPVGVPSAGEEEGEYIFGPIDAEQLLELLDEEKYRGFLALGNWFFVEIEAMFDQEVSSITWNQRIQMESSDEALNHDWRDDGAQPYASVQNASSLKMTDAPFRPLMISALDGLEQVVDEDEEVVFFHGQADAINREADLTRQINAMVLQQGPRTTTWSFETTLLCDNVEKGKWVWGFTLTESAGEDGAYDVEIEHAEPVWEPTE